MTGNTTNRQLRMDLRPVIVTGAGASEAEHGRRACRFRYATADPWAVTLDFTQGQGWVRWSFARTLLADGLNTPTGEGDVTVSPSHDGAHVYVALSSPSGAVVLRFERREVEHALDRCEALVPEGAEHAAVDWDRELALLGKAA